MSAHAERIRGIADGVNSALNRFAKDFSAIPDEAALIAGTGNGWNAAEIATHVAIANEWVAGVLSGEIQAAQPAPSGFRENWSVIVIPDRMQTFPSMVPPGGVTRLHAANQLARANAGVVQAIAHLDESRASQVVTFPFGTLSLYQVAEFVDMHANRHVAQLHRLPILAQVPSTTSTV